MIFPRLCPPHGSQQPRVRCQQGFSCWHAASQACPDPSRAQRCHETEGAKTSWRPVMSASSRASSIPALCLLPPCLTSCWLSPSPPPSVSLPFLPCSARAQHPPPVVITTSISPWRLCQPFQQKHLLGGQSTSSVPEPSGCGGEETKALPQAEGQGLPPACQVFCHVPSSQRDTGTHTSCTGVLPPPLPLPLPHPSLCLSEPQQGEVGCGEPQYPWGRVPCPLASPGYLSSL